MFEFVNITMDEAPFNSWSANEQMGMLLDAYDEKKFRECVNHAWELCINFGEIDISCAVCHGSYGHLYPDYQDYVCFITDVSKLDWRKETSYYDDGESYLDVIV